VTSIATYDLATGSLRDDCVRSGVTSPVLAQELSGDVVLPSAPQERGELVVIDRKNAVLTFVAPTSCMPRAQLSVSTGGFKSNPHDVVSVSTHKAYVVRYDANLAPTSDPSDFDEGDDLLVIDPSIPMILGRVPLSGYAATTGAGFHANPDRALLVGGLVYVTLNNLGKDAAGPGRGFVDMYSLNGKLLGRVASRGPLDSPWGLALAPNGFGRFGGDLLVGNFGGDGRINAYALESNGSAEHAGTLRRSNGQPGAVLARDGGRVADAARARR
jgi:hypothetical protein